MPGEIHPEPTDPPTHCAIFPDQDLDATIKNCAEVPALRAEVFGQRLERFAERERGVERFTMIYH